LLGGKRHQLEARVDAPGRLRPWRLVFRLLWLLFRVLSLLVARLPPLLLLTRLQLRTPSVWRRLLLTVAVVQCIIIAIAMPPECCRSVPRRRLIAAAPIVVLLLLLLLSGFLPSGLPRRGWVRLPLLLLLLIWRCCCVAILPQALPRGRGAAVALLVRAGCGGALRFLCIFARAERLDEDLVVSRAGVWRAH